MAIELAAAPARMLAVDQISQRLDDASRLLTAVGLYEPAAHLDVYARSERIRVKRPIPKQFQAERDRSRAAIAGHVSDVEAIDESWVPKGKDDVVPLLGEHLDRIGRVLSQSPIEE